VTLSAWDVNAVPTAYALEQNYPNPFNPSTQIRYALPEEARVTISVYDLMGRKVRTLVNGVQSAGYRSVVWNATNDMGRQVSAGVYIYSIQSGDFVQNRKLVLMK
jgi:flagellar hook assembly protein FlgD